MHFYVKYSPNIYKDIFDKTRVKYIGLIMSSKINRGVQTWFYYEFTGRSVGPLSQWIYNYTAGMTQSIEFAS